MQERKKVRKKTSRSKTGLAVGDNSHFSRRTIAGFRKNTGKIRQIQKLEKYRQTG